MVCFCDTWHNIILPAGFCIPAMLQCWMSTTALLTVIRLKCPHGFRKTLIQFISVCFDPAGISLFCRLNMCYSIIILCFDCDHGDVCLESDGWVWSLWVRNRCCNMNLLSECQTEESWHASQMKEWLALFHGFSLWSRWAADYAVAKCFWSL